MEDVDSTVANSIRRAYKAWKRIMHVVCDNSAIERISRVGFLAEIESNKSGQNVRLLRRQIWQLYGELMISDQLPHMNQVMHDIVIELTDGSKTEADMCTQLATEVCNRKHIPIPRGSKQLSLSYMFICKSLLTIVRIASARHLLKQAAATSVVYGENTDIFEELESLLVLGSGEKKWQAVGFQGKDPSTDFRRTGMVGLRFILHMAKYQPDDTTLIISESRTDIGTDIWYPFALAAIHTVDLLLRLPEYRFMETFIYRCGFIHSTDNVLASFYRLCGYILIEYHESWKKDVTAGKYVTIMDFEQSFKRFSMSLDL
ncbi:hypothetical protein CANCADRAFT_30 [Tortispora caseinolytica NRRL Y-17796]|uniref:ELMO domain-containing protein n=1 Tax=Tortispora caseinolytica NRRL Y-17796 TaxID=767744 RepID=A0A1E4TI64_9ASCO|nr:hypothetical protein CANCADRAFT_30 [Tortispora caseinolytica NRRL Y-17796]